MSSTSEQQAKFSPQQAWGQLVKHFCTWQAYDAKFTQGMWKDPMGTIERKWGYTLVQVELLIAIAAIGCTVLARNQLTPAASSQEGTGDTGPTTKEPVSGFNFNLETDNSSLAMVAAAEKATGVAFETSGPPMDLEDFDRDRLIMQAVQFNQPWGQENMIVYCARGAQGNSACGFAGLNNASWSEPRLDDFPWQWSGGASLIGNKVVELELPSLTLVYDAQDRPTFLADEQEGIKLINAALDDGSILAGEVQRIDADGVEVNVKGNGGLLKKISGLIGKLLRTNEKVVQAQNVVAAFTLTPSSTPPPTETDKPTATATSTATLRPTPRPTFVPPSQVPIQPTVEVQVEVDLGADLGWPAETHLNNAGDYVYETDKQLSSDWELPGYIYLWRCDGPGVENCHSLQTTGSPSISAALNVPLSPPLRDGEVPTYLYVGRRNTSSTNLHHVVIVFVKLYVPVSPS